MQRAKKKEKRSRRRSGKEAALQEEERREKNRKEEPGEPDNGAGEAEASQSVVSRGAADGPGR